MARFLYQQIQLFWWEGKLIKSVDFSAARYIFGASLKNVVALYVCSKSEKPICSLESYGPVPARVLCNAGRSECKLCWWKAVYLEMPLVHHEIAFTALLYNRSKHCGCENHPLVMRSHTLIVFHTALYEKKAQKIPGCRNKSKCTIVRIVKVPRV